MGFVRFAFPLKSEIRVENAIVVNGRSTVHLNLGKSTFFYRIVGKRIFPLVVTATIFRREELGRQIDN